MLFCIHHTLSILTGPNIFLNICLSKMRWLFSSFAVKVQVSDEYVTTGLIIVLYIWVWPFTYVNLRLKNSPGVAQESFILHTQFQTTKLDNNSTSSVWQNA
jgi:hypothetical protein